MPSGVKRRMRCPDCGKECAAMGVFAYKDAGHPAAHKCPHGRVCLGAKGTAPKERCSECRPPEQPG